MVAGHDTRFLADAFVRPLAGLTLRGVDTLDGMKWLYDEAWVFFWASGTEPVVRIYAEATRPDLVQALLEEARGLLQPRCVCSSLPAFHAVDKDGGRV